MKKTWMFAGSVCFLAIAAVVVTANMLAHGGSTVSTPEFILPESVSATSATSCVISSADAPVFTTAEGTTAQPDETLPQQETAMTTSPETAPVTETHIAETSEKTTVPSPAETTASPAETTSRAASATTVTTAASSQPEPEIIPDNVMLTSHDPLHHVRFEFNGRTINFTGVYSGDGVDDVYIHRAGLHSWDLSQNGDKFSGNIDISTLDNGYYIIIVKLHSGAAMYYVFNVASDGAHPISAKDLPAEDNLAFLSSPMELPKDGVLNHITVSGSEATAAEILREIKSISDQVCAGLSDDYSKSRALAQWVSGNMYYDHDAANNGVTEEDISLEFVLKNHRSVCFGWSNLYSALCQAQGIKCYNASGSAVTGSRCFLQTTTEDERSHSWNLVVIDGRYIWVDTVWDSGNSYRYGQYNTGVCDLEYFDKDNTALAHDHRVTRLEYRDYFGYFPVNEN